MYLKTIVSLLLLFFLSSSVVCANLDDSIFIIKSTWPSNGQTNVPVDLISGLAGSVSSNGIGSIGIGYGTDLSGGCGSPPNCPNIPEIVNNSINSSTVTISSSNDQDISIKYREKGTCYGDCYGSDSFYHNFSIVPVNSFLPNGIKLMPNTAYTVTIRGGSSGISALRGSKNVFLPSDYSWSFTTGSGEQPQRVATPTVSPTQISPKPSVQNGSSDEDMARLQQEIADQKRKTEELKKQPTPTPTPVKKITPTKKVTSTPPSTPSATISQLSSSQSSTLTVENSTKIKSFYEFTLQSFQSIFLRFVTFIRSPFLKQNTQ